MPLNGAVKRAGFVAGEMRGLAQLSKREPEMADASSREARRVTRARGQRSPSLMGGSDFYARCSPVECWSLRQNVRSGHSRRSELGLITSALPRQADMPKAHGHVSKVHADNRHVRLLGAIRLIGRVRNASSST